MTVANPGFRLEVPPAPGYARLARFVVGGWVQEVLNADLTQREGVEVAVTELFSNARTAQEQQGVATAILIEGCTLEDGRAQIALEDAGGGIRNVEPAGLGVGLKLARAFVDDLDLEPSDRGTRAVMRLDPLGD